MGEGCESSKEIEWVSPQCMHGELRADAMQVLPLLSGKSPTFLFEAGSGKIAKKFKKTKIKTPSKKRGGDITVDAHFDVCNELDVGEKRKFVDNMFVDDEVDLVESGSKKQKVTGTNMDGNDFGVVEAEVGHSQPRRAF